MTHRLTLRAVSIYLAGGLAMAGLTFTSSLSARRAQESLRHGTNDAALRATLSRLPLAFERNEGQSDPRVRYLSRGPGYSLFLTPDEAVLRLQGAGGGNDTEETGATVRMRLKGANPRPEVNSEHQLPGVSRYYFGNDPRAWRGSVERFARVRYEEVYPGVDLVYYGREGELEYDYVVGPGADPDRIRMQISGVERARLSPEGDLVLQTAAGELKQHRPYVYQEVGGTRKQVQGRYLLAEADSDREFGVRFELGPYDRTRTLVIDPVLSYSTYLGGSGIDFGVDIEVDAQGYMYVTGRTASVNFPVANPQQGLGGGSGAPTSEGNDSFVTKLTPNGDALVFSTYLGGSGLDWAHGLALDSDRSVYLVGQTNSSNFPVQSALQPQGAGGWDAFVTKLDTDGFLVFSTYLGGNSTDFGAAILHDGQGNLFLGGTTFSFNFPTLNALQPTHANAATPTAALEDAFVAKLGADGANLQFSTYLGAGLRDTCQGLALDPAGNLCIGGDTTSTNFPVTPDARQPVQAGRTDAFYTKLTADGSVRLYSTYFGGNFEDRLHGFGVDAQGSVYFSGFTFSTNLPTTFGAICTVYQGGNSDGFLAKLNAAGNAYVYVTYLGGSGSIEYAYDVAPEASGNVYVAGTSESSNFPQTDPFMAHNTGQNAFVMRLNPAGQRIYSTLLTGMSDNAADYAYAIATDANGNAYVTGRTYARNWPLANPLQAVSGGVSTGDAFVVKLSPLHTVAPSFLQCRANTPYEAGLSWTDQSNNETGFSLERSTNAVTYAVIATLPPDTTSYADPGRNPGTTYWYRLRGFNGEGYTDYTGNAITMPTDPPAAPSNLTVTAISSTDLRLSWNDNSSNESGFRIERSTDGATFTQVAQVGANVTTHTDTGLSGNTTYTYRIRAFNGSGNSAYSPAAGALTHPAAPSALTGQAITGTRVDLTWTDNNSNPTPIEVERSIDGGVIFVPIVTAAAGAGGFSDTSLENEKTYHYRVRAVNSSGSSAYSDVIAVTTPLDPPAAPGTLSATYLQASRAVHLAWSDLSGNEGGFRVERSSDEGTTWSLLSSTAAGATSFSDPAWIPDAVHSYRVRAFNPAGESANSNVVTIPVPPIAPSNLTAQTGDAGQILLNWSDNSIREDDYVVERKTGSGDWQEAGVVAANSMQTVDVGLAPDTLYMYRVRARNAVDVSDASNEASAHTLPNPPSAPNGLTVRALSQGELQISWTDNSSNEGGFHVELWNGSQFNTVATVGANVTGYTHPGLAANTLYTYQVRAFNAGGVSGSGQSVGAYTLPATPSGLGVRVVSMTELELSWTDNNPSPTGHEIERSTNGMTFSPSAVTGAGVTTYRDGGLLPGTTYYYRVCAVNVSGSTPYSNSANATTPLPPPPAAPSDLTGTALSTSQIRLSWRDNSTNESEFRIERSTNGSTFTQVGTVGANTIQFTSTGLAKNTKYWFRVRAANAGGTSGYSNTINLRTKNK